MNWRQEISRSPDEYELCLKLLSSSLFIYSGGSRWDTVHERVQGRKLPWYQTQGNTWNRAIDKGIIPEVIYQSCGSNDMDRYNDLYYEAFCNSHWWHLLICSDYGPSDYYMSRHNVWYDKVDVCPMEIIDWDNLQFIADCHAEVKGHIDTVVKAVNKQFTGCANYAMEIICRKVGSLRYKTWHVGYRRT